MSKNSKITLGVVATAVLLVVGLILATNYFNNLPARISQHETIILGQNKLVPGSQAGLRVVVRDSKDGEPLEDAEIIVKMKPAAGGKAVEVFRGTTDSQGSSNVNFTVPDSDDPNQTLVVETKSKLGSDYVEREVSLSRDFRILVSTDKPIYQPGQEIHVRLLVLSTFDLTPAAGQEISLSITDGKGNRVYRETLTTNEYGVAAADFQLASEVNTGNYKINAEMGTVASEKTVTVEHYVLPKFEISLQTDKSYYMPGQTVTGSLNAAYFFGKPVAGGTIEIEGYTFDFERVVTFTLTGTTDEDGNFEFSFELPDYIAGSDLESGLGRFYIQASVTDLAEHTEISNTSLPVASSVLIIEAIPEGGQFKVGIENILYVMTSYPDGTPAATDLTVEVHYEGKTITTESNGYGLAEVRFTPTNSFQEITITARDEAGNLSTQYFYFDGSWEEESVLLRPDKPVYRVGETMNLTIQASQASGTAYLDIVREGQTISTRSVTIEDGRADIAIDLTPEMYGTLEIHAYKILSSGSIVRDTRLVVVDNAEGLSLSITPDKEIYLPGKTAGVDISVTGTDGSGAQAALGIAIVDESVFALAQQDPGFAKLYFMLEAELLQPKFELHGFSIPDLVTGVPVSAEPFVQAIEDAATASLASAVSRTFGFTLSANSHEDAIQRAAEKQVAFYSTMSRVFFGLAMLLPFGILVYNGWLVEKQGRFWPSLAITIGGILILFLIIAVWPHPWAATPLEKIIELIDWLSWYDGFLYGLLCGLGLVTLIGLIALIATSVKEKDRGLGLAMIAFPIFIGLLLGAVNYSSRGDVYPEDSILMLALIAIFLLPFTFALRSAGFVLNQKWVAALSSFAVSLAVLSFTVPLIAMATFGGMVGLGDGMVNEQLGFIDAVDEDGGEFFRAELPMVEAGAPMEEMEDKSMDTEAAAPDSAGQGSEPPYLRQYFPETMLWLPMEETDSSGALHLDIPVADTITTWRMTTLAATQDGRLGNSITPILVFQDFFIDLDLPVALTVGDEISLPVGVFNYLETSQTVRLEIEEADWFLLLDEREKTIEIGSNDITVVYFRIKVLEFGTQGVKVTAWGSAMSDAILKQVRVYPDGKQVNVTTSNRLEIETPVTEKILIPAEAISGTESLVVKIYPGVVSQVVEGLDSILQMPNGCFEQTSSTTYPNVLVLDYLRTTGQTSPEVEFKAEEYINLGYQRLVTFEVPGHPGGFSLFGDPPPDVMLTAYGLQEFNDMSKVHPVDPNLMARTAQWLLGQQNPDGSWEGKESFHESTLTSQVAKLPVTAYVVWGLADAGYAGDSRTLKGVQYLVEFQGEATDAYTLGLVANALASYDLESEGELGSTTLSVLDRLAGMATMDGASAYWSAEFETYYGSYGETAKLETTALAALALLRANTNPELANAGLNFLVQNKDSFGTWQTTQATVLALKAMLESVKAGSESVDATVTIKLNGEEIHTVRVTPENFDVVQMVKLDGVEAGRDNHIEITVEGEGSLMYQVTGGYYLPWEVLPEYPELLEPYDLMSINVTYDRTVLAVDDTVKVNVSLKLNEGVAESAIIDLGIPPGFAVETADLAALVAYYNDMPESYELPKIERFELTGRQIILYLTNLSSEHTLEFSFRMRAKFPLKATTPASNAYDYYNPNTSGLSLPQIIEVTE